MGQVERADRRDQEAAGELVAGAGVTVQTRCSSSQRAVVIFYPNRMRRRRPYRSATRRRQARISGRVAKDRDQSGFGSREKE